MLENLDEKVEDDLVINYGFIRKEINELLKCINYHCYIQEWKGHYALNFNAMKSECLLFLFKEYPKYKRHRKSKRVNGMKWLIKNYIKSLHSPFRAIKRTPVAIIRDCEISSSNRTTKKAKRQFFYDRKRRMYVREFREFVLYHGTKKTKRLYMEMINNFAGEDSKYGLKRDLEKHMGCRHKGLESQLKELKKLFTNYFTDFKDFSENSDKKLYYNSISNN